MPLFISPTSFGQAMALLLIGIGLAGSVLPIVPGAFLIWLGALLWALLDGFATVGWPTLIVLGLLATLSYASNTGLTVLLARHVGASWKAIAASIGGGILGAILLSGLPLLGTIIGTILGACLGMVLFEYYDKRDLRQAIRASTGYIVGYLMSSVVELFFALLMVALFAWQAFFAN